MSQDKTLPRLPVPDVLEAGYEPGTPPDAYSAAAVQAYGERCVAAHLERTGQSVTNEAVPSPTAGMTLAQRILHVGGRNNAAGYVEFGSTQAVEALVRQVLRDLPAVSAKAGSRGTKVPAWIRVEDQLPSLNTEVQIAFRDSTLPSTGQYTASPHDHDGWCFPKENDPEEVGPITHWMDLPPHPSEINSATSPEAATAEAAGKAPASVPSDAEDAERWRAFLSSGRIKFFGFAGIKGDGKHDPAALDPNGKPYGNYAHFGGEFWSTFPETIYYTDAAREKANNVLTEYADACRAALAAQPRSTT